VAIEVIRTVCPHDCPDACSMLATVEDGRVVSVVGDPDHPFTRGFLCGKVARYQERVHAPERLLHPLRRTGPKGEGSFVPISWDEALDEIVSRWQRVIAEYGSEALVGYVYSGHQGLVNRNVPRALFHALGASRFLAGTVCDSTAEAAWTYAVGDTPGTDPETIVDSDLIVCWGANVVSVNVHMVPFIDEAQAKGAKLVVVDPYRTRTARRADWHLMPRIGSDGALALGVMHVIVRDGLADTGFLAARAVGFEQFRDEVLPLYSPERAAAIADVAPADVERLAHLYAQARAPFLRIGQGMSRNNNGGMAVRTVALLPALVGGWGKPGAGAHMSSGSIYQFDVNALRRPELLARPTREINHSLLGRSLLELRDPPIMALFVGSNNPAVTCPDQVRTVAGLSREDLFTVVHDTFLSDTARFADVVLPACTAFETEDIYRGYGTYYVQHGPLVIPQQGESLSNLQLVQVLAERLGLADPVFTRSTREHIAALLAGASGPTATITLDRLLTGEPIKLPYAQTGPKRTYFVSAAMAEAGLPALPEWRPDPAEPPADSPWPLRLLTAPGHHQAHTTFSFVERARRLDGNPRCLLHPDEAARRNLENGQAVAVANARGFVGLRLKVTTDARPGVVVVEGQKNRATYLAGGPINVLTDDTLADMGGGATYQSTWVDVRPLALV
jgi:anaerobic selenocysteine-containing dehydrogenase